MYFFWPRYYLLTLLCRLWLLHFLLFNYLWQSILMRFEIFIHLYHCNGYILTWILHQIFMFSNKNNTYSVLKYQIPPPSHSTYNPIPYFNPITSLVSNLKWRQLFHCQDIHVHLYPIDIVKWKLIIYDVKQMIVLTV